MSKRRFFCLISLVLVVLFSLVFNSCSAKPENPEGSSGRNLVTDYEKVSLGKGFFSIGNITYETPDPSLKIGCLVTENSPGFHHYIYEALQTEIKANGVTSLISVCDNDVTKQVQQIENYIAQNVDGLILLSATPVDGINLALEKAYEAGIPVVAIDVFPDTEAKYLTGVFTDAYELAYRATKSVLETYKEKTGSYVGKLGIIGGSEGNTTADRRNQGMRDAIEDVTGGAMQEVSFIYCGGFTEELGLIAAENMLVQQPDINIILPTSEAIALGAIAACENAGVADQIMMATIDGSKNALQIIKDGGPIKAIGINSPVVVAQGGVRLLLAYIVEGTLPEFKEQVLEPEVASPENIDQYYDPAAIF